MSLHLIESRQVRRAGTRKSGGAAVSLVIHLLLVTVAFTVAAAAPRTHPSKDPTVHTVFVTPVVPPPSVNRAQSSANSGARGVQRDTRLIDLSHINMNADIPTSIPPIDAGSIAIDDHTTFGPPSGNGRKGAGLGSGDLPDIFDAPQVDKPVVALAGFRLPQYPEELRLAGVQATVIATFVVDTLGLIESTSISIVAERAAFANAVRSALAGARFRPAEASGHRVRQRVSQPFVFSLDKR